jgi:hypothetical protein
MGQGFPLGTGQGVSRRIPPAEVRVPKLEAWAAKPTAPAADGAKAVEVPTLAELKAADPAAAEAFDDLAADGWRAFRRHLDHCGECPAARWWWVERRLAAARVRAPPRSSRDAISCCCAIRPTPRRRAVHYAECRICELVTLLT